MDGAARFWGARLRRGTIVAAAFLWALVSLGGCLVTAQRIPLGAPARPLPSGTYVDAQDPETIVRGTLEEDGVYRGAQLEMAFYESGLAPDVYFIAFTEYPDDQSLPPQVLYGLGRVETGAEETALVYEAVICSDVPPAAAKRLGLTPEGGSCRMRDAEQIRAALTAIWTERAGRAPSETRYVLQKEAGR